MASWFTRVFYNTSHLQVRESLSAVLPAHREGVEDGEKGEGVTERLAEYEPLTNVERAYLIGTLTIHQARLNAERDKAIQDQVRHELELERDGDIAPVSGFGALLVALWLLLVFAETYIYQGTMSVFGELDDAARWFTGFAFAMGPPFLLKLVISQHEPLQTRRGGETLQWSLFALAPITTIAAAWYRFGHESVLESRRYEGGVMQQMIDANGAPMLLVLTVMSLTLSGLTAFLWEPLNRYIRIYYHRGHIALLRAKIRKIDISLAQIEPTRIQRERCLAAIRDSSKAEYLHAVAVTGVKAPSIICRFKSVLAAGALSGFAVSAGALVHRAAVHSGMDPLMALILGGGIFAMIACGGMFFAMPYLKKDSPVPNILAVVVPLAMLLIPSLFLGGCAGAPKPKKTDAAVIFDVSGSVKGTDEDGTMAAIMIASRLPRCSKLTIIPINARAGAVFEVKLPCKPARFDDDLKAVYKQIKTQLPVQLSVWRNSAQLSDYRNAFKLAAERLEFSPNRTLIVLGDLIDDHGREAGDKSPPAPKALTFPAQTFRSAKIYLGFMDSTELDRMKSQERVQFEQNWRRTVAAAGASDSDITVRSFGLQGLEAWSDAVIGPVTPAYEEFARSKGGRQ